MAKSFLLKDGSGRIGGYLQVRADGIRCRVEENRENTVMILYDRREQERRFELQPKGTEQCFPAIATEIIGVVIVRKENLWLISDDEAGHVYRKKRESAKRILLERAAKEKEKENEKENENEERGPEQKQDPCRSETQAHAEQGKCGESQECLRTIWPQRRWPPLLCCPYCVYRHGEWHVGEAD